MFSNSNGNYPAMKVETGLLDAEGLAGELRVSKRVIGNMRRAKIIPCIKLNPHTIRYDLEAVVAALKARSEEVSDE